ncbi:Fic family protein [Candidatus Rariloculus sp.]|uniref:Fic family protein n=1 Tax=Candidatus Rariloculus sp. TaxID=3101265 RepID=UPI003D144EE5
MVRRIPEDNLQAILEAVRRNPDGMTARQVADSLEDGVARRTLQYRLKALVDDRRLFMEGSGRWARYRAPRAIAVSARPMAAEFSVGAAGGVVLPPLSEAGSRIREYVRQPPQARKPMGYDSDVLDAYRPNETFYLAPAERAQLREIGTPEAADQPAGTYAKKLMNRLLIPLAWNSSRLEGNTYSLLETHRLIEAGEEAQGRDRREAQMILNHKDAIELLVDSAEDIGFNRYTLLNLHAALADGLLADPEAAGRLRHMGVGIAGSVFHPLEVPQLIEDRFDQVLAAAARIEDPFEQAFFSMVQLPYQQPFDDVNKRVSRLAANIPLIKANLSPLSFDDVPRDLYTEAILGVYELKRTELLRDVFLWAYGRSAARYGAVRQSLGEPDPFRMRQRAALRELVGTVIRGGMGKKQASTHVREWTAGRIDAPEREQFRQIAERELLSLHSGNCARYRVTPAEFSAWQKAWSE